MYEDLTNCIFGDLKVIGLEGKHSRGRYKWLCECQCGGLVDVYGSDLRSSKRTHCGCKKKRFYTDLTGQTFNNLTVIQFAGLDKHKTALWLCRCVCGIEKTIPSQPLKEGRTKSCGCFYQKQRKELAEKLRSWHKQPENYLKYVHSLPKSQQHHRYNKDIPEEDRGSRKFLKRTSSYHHWREQILKRDNEKCCRCLSSKSLVAHHILPWAYYKELRYDIENGITLCIQCHNLFHKIYCKSKQLTYDDTISFLNNYYRSSSLSRDNVDFHPRCIDQIPYPDHN